ncbi:unnamed protein product [Zymoseptoria tritici ST99CH_3D7]|uniref:Extracellular membrane protein CFEM domain-containing protein n=1 Tax=Zymoseptoria tritici (strain ST99CH_3D7) TaxID=1276538 RepID=A0A1X7S8V2_ZYMT9|nr:unnamed protein product [Zymoseptoria tritici ST99CH_3D7]
MKFLTSLLLAATTILATVHAGDRMQCRGRTDAYVKDLCENASGRYESPTYCCLSADYHDYFIAQCNSVKGGVGSDAPADPVNC